MKLAPAGFSPSSHRAETVMTITEARRFLKKTHPQAVCLPPLDYPFQNSEKLA